MSALQSTLPIVENKTLRLYKFFTYFTLTLSSLALLLVIGVVSGLLSDTMISGLPTGLISLTDAIKQNPFNFTMAIVLFPSLLISWLMIRYEKKKSALSLDFVIDASEFSDKDLAEFLKDQRKRKGIRYKLVEYIFLRRKLKDPASTAKFKQTDEDNEPDTASTDERFENAIDVEGTDIQAETPILITDNDSYSTEKEVKDQREGNSVVLP